MTRLSITLLALALCNLASIAFAEEQPPYDVYPDAEPPYYRVRYEASTEEGELDLPVKYTVWVPPGVETLRGVVVHQHGCGEGSCKSGLTGAFDLHWQALAAKHGCALFAASYEQPQNAACSRWCDPRNGSDAAFQRSLVDLGQASGHPELATVPWALWGHSGGGYWSGIMTMLHPERVAASWLRSGAPVVKEWPERPEAIVVDVPEQTFPVPMMLNMGTEEGVTMTDTKFQHVWPKAVEFATALRTTGSPIGIAVDPLTGHQCGNQRYLAVPWFDHCLSVRLPDEPGQPLRAMPTGDSWLVPLTGPHGTPSPADAVRSEAFEGKPESAVWIPTTPLLASWTQYVTDTDVADSSAPPAPTNLALTDGTLTWDAAADLQSGVRQFLILRDGQQIGAVPAKPRNRYGRPLFQDLQYSDTPAQPLATMSFEIPAGSDATVDRYEVITVNTAGLKSE